MNTYTIAATSKAKVQAAIEKWNKRGGNFAAVVFGEPYEKKVIEVIDRIPIEFPVQVLDVTIEGEYRPSEEYALIAKLDKVGKSNIVLQLSSETECPEEYRTYDNHCDHCDKRRARNVHYIVKQLDTGEFLKIGSSCLELYFPQTANECVRGAMWYSHVVAALEDDELKDFKGNWASHGYKSKYVLGLALDEVRKNGYVKTECDYDEIPTRDVIKKQYGEGYFVGLAEPEKAKATEQMLEWFDAQEATTNYMHNIKAILSEEFVNDKHLGLLVSAASVYLNAMEREAQQKQTATENTVTPDDGRYNIEGRVVSFKEYRNEYGITVKVLVQCEGYRLFGTIPKSIRYDAEIGDTVSFTATVKAVEAGFGKYSRPSSAHIVARADH